MGGYLIESHFVLISYNILAYFCDQILLIKYYFAALGQKNWKMKKSTKMEIQTRLKLKFWQEFGTAWTTSDEGRV